MKLAKEESAPIKVEVTASPIVKFTHPLPFSKLTLFQSFKEGIN